MQTATVENGKGTAAKLAHLTARVAEGKMLAERLCRYRVAESPTNREEGI